MWLAPCRQPGLFALLSRFLPTLMGRMARSELSRFLPASLSVFPQTLSFSCHQPSPPLLLRGGGVQPGRECVATLSWQLIAVSLPGVKAMARWDLFPLPP